MDRLLKRIEYWWDAIRTVIILVFIWPWMVYRTLVMYFSGAGDGPEYDAWRRSVNPYDLVGKTFWQELKIWCNWIGRMPK
jgi:hypothetical protein